MSTEPENPWLAAAAAQKKAREAEEQQAAADTPAKRPSSSRPSEPSDGNRRPKWFKTSGSRATPPGAAAPVNPFLPATPAAETTTDEGEYAPVMTSGPATPTGAPAPTDPLLSVPDRFDRARAHPGLVVQVAGLHGGAGTSTVASLLGREAIDCGVGLNGLVAPELPVVFVARTHAHGLDLVKRAAAQWASRGLDSIHVLGVVLVDDAPALSKGLQREVRSVERALPHAWRIAWSEEWRHDLDLPGEAAKGRLRRIRKSLLDQAHKLPRDNAAENTTTRTEGTA